MLKFNIYHILTLVIILNLAIDSVCQVSEKPNPPNVYFVSVEPETGDVKIVWIPSSSANVHLYIILKAEFTGGPNYPPAYVEIGRVPSADSVFIYEDSKSLFHSDGYTVESLDTISGLSDFNQLVDSTIFLSAEFDSCSSNISLSWNDYNRWRGSIKEYNIYSKINEVIPSLLLTLPEGTNNYTVENIQTNCDYGFYIEAVHSDEKRKSTSNMAQINTDVTSPPEYINADYATISGGNNIELSFTIDPSSELNYYKLYRSNSIDGPFNIIDSFYSSEKRIIYIDAIDYTSGIYYYKLESMNNCNQVARKSNISNNILLSGENNNLTNVLTWNGISDWEGSILNYKLIRITGESMNIIDTVYQGRLLFYEDDLSGLIGMDQPFTNYFCYKIKASEANNPYGHNNISYSNEICISISSEIRMPNAFIPDNDVNNVFGPVFNFEPSGYKLTIYNRLGIKVWEGTEPWNGLINGDPAPKGYYLYHIKVYTANDGPVEKKGFVFLFYR
jgi:hypothetical protein